MKAGAKEGLLTAIARKQKKRSEEIIQLNKEYRENFPGRDVETRRKLIALGRELLDRIGDPDLLVGAERTLRELVVYLKEVLPKMEMRLHEMLKSKPDQ